MNDSSYDDRLAAALHEVNSERTCAERLQGHLNGRLEDLRVMLELPDDWETISNADLLMRPDEYGLSLSLESKNYRTDTWCFRWLLSTGGPADWFDISVDENGTVQRVVYDFQDWGDNATKDLFDDERETVENFVSRFLYLAEPQTWESRS